MGGLSPNSPSFVSSSTRINYVYFSSFFWHLPVCLLFVYSTIAKRKKIICFKTLQGALKAIVLVVQIQLFSHLSLSPGKLFLGSICLFLRIITFLCSSISLHKKWSFPLRISAVNVTKSLCKTSFFVQCFPRTIQSLHINFFTDVLNITLRVNSLKNFFATLTFLLGVRYILGRILWYFLLFLGSFYTLSYNILYRYFLHFSDSQCAEKSFTACISMMVEFCSSFWSNIGILSHVLRNLKHSLDIWHKTLDIIAVVTKLKNVLSLFLLCIFLDVSVQFLVCPSNIREQSKIFMWALCFIFLYC